MGEAGIGFDEVQVTAALAFISGHGGQLAVFGDAGVVIIVTARDHVPGTPLSAVQANIREVCGI